jgi:hypothetical protein
VLVGLGLSFVIGGFGDRAVGLTQEGSGPAADPVKKLLARMTAHKGSYEGSLIVSIPFPPDIVAEARTLWPQLGASLAKDIPYTDKRLILDLVKQCGPEARSILREVCRSVESGLPEDQVTTAIKAICSDRDNMVKELEMLSRDKSMDQRGRFPWMLAVVEVPANQLIPIEHSLMEDPDPDVRVAATDALAHTFGQFNRLVFPLVPTLMRAALEDPDDRVRISAQQGLIRGGLASGAALDIFIQSLEAHEIDEPYFDVVFISTTRFSEAAAFRVDKMLRSETPRVRRWGVRLATRALPWTRVGLLPKLRKAAEDPDPGVKKEAQAVLDALEGKN